MLLRSTFITLLRDLQVLDGQKFTVHLKIYYNGTYTPYALAMVCALKLLKIVESKVSFNPLIRHALAMSVDLVKVSFSGQTCHLSGQHAVRNGAHWSDIGDQFWVDGIPVCVCKLALWVGRFEKAIQDQDLMVESSPAGGCYTWPIQSFLTKRILLR